MEQNHSKRYNHQNCRNSRKAFSGFQDSEIEVPFIFEFVSIFFGNFFLYFRLFKNLGQGIIQQLIIEASIRKDLFT